MPVCLRSQLSCHASLKFAGYSNPLNGDILKMSNLKLSQPGVFIVYDHTHTLQIIILIVNAKMMGWCINIYCIFN